MINTVFVGIFIGITPILSAYYILNFEKVQLYIKTRHKKNIIRENNLFFHSYHFFCQGEELSLSILSPNGISFLRTAICFIAIIIYYFSPSLFPVYLFIFASSLDAVDGIIARICDLSTEFGKKFDPLCDKLCYLLPMVYFNADSPLVYILIFTEFFGQFYIRHYLASRNRSVAANNIGKIKAVVCFCSVPYFFLIDMGANLPKFSHQLLLICLILSIGSVIFKLIPNRLYADILSALNLSCGIFSIIIFLWKKNFSYSLISIMAGQFFDLFDGRMARKHGGTKFGALWDNGADFVSFGLSPAILVLCKQFQHHMLSGLISSLFYCGAILFRLLRYIKIDKKRTDLPNGIFCGLPSPGAAAIVLGANVILPVLSLNLIIFITAVLAVSKIHFTHFNEIVQRIPIIFKVGGGSLICIITAYNLNKPYSNAFAYLLFLGGLVYLIIGKLLKPKRISP